MEQFVAKQITYQMVNGNVVMYGNHNAIRLIADILAASTSSLPQVSASLMLPHDHKRLSDCQRRQQPCHQILKKILV